MTFDDAKSTTGMYLSMREFGRREKNPFPGILEMGDLHDVQEEAHAGECPNGERLALTYGLPRLRTGSAATL